ncbi:DNA topoisomerase 2-associated protein pat1 [Elasticomyces elasticus]|nr:DNA topoisomerase 2-associated protein pat1 [Elasticomyces elasticus]
MSFFGFDATLPRDREQRPGLGFSQPPNPFAGAAHREPVAGEEILDFEDTYDGLGDELDEAGDTFNVDTFGGGNVGRDFDFSGQTAKVASTLQEEQMLHYIRQPPPNTSPPKPTSRLARTGYENYAQPDYIPQLEANASIWGLPQRQTNQIQQTQEPGATSAGQSRKMMSLDEVEAAMRAQRQQKFGEQPFAQQPAPVQEMQHPPPPSSMRQQEPPPGPPQILQRPQPRPSSSSAQRQPELPVRTPTHAQPVHGSQQPQQPFTPPVQPVEHRASPQPIHILRNPNRLSGQNQLPPAQANHQLSGTLPPDGSALGRGPPYGGPPITQAQQMMQLSEEDRAAYMTEEAKRAKRNHKIWLLSRDNGLMTPQDKNFITRIQLQQLLTVTGNVDDQSPEATLSEDFYYQVYSQIRGAPRQNPNQPLNLFAQTYLLQTGGRYGGRRHPRGGDNHMQRMEQQVQRAVEAAKAKPKNKQLVVEGSLGKISFSNSKAPKPLLSFKRPDNTETRPQSARAKSGVVVADKKATLRDIENVYTTLMQMEDHERLMPPPPNEESDAAVIQEHIEWRQKIQSLNEKLWANLKVMEPIVQNSPTPHPFIAILSRAKGKKLIPRVFRHIDDNQRITILTIIVVHLDMLDVVRNAYPTPETPQARDEVELFSQVVMPSLFAYVNEAPLNIAIGLLGLVVDRVNVQAIVRTKIGVSVLTMLISRAELVKQALASHPSPSSAAEVEEWNSLYNRLFDLTEPVLPYIFPGENANQSADDVYVWQFLAAMGVGASPEQQQRLVMGVKERVMESVGVARTLPAELGARKLAEVNLFMRAIGLDVDLLG